MGEHKERTGKTRVGKFLSTLGNVAPDLIELAGDVTGIEVLEKLGSAIKKDKGLTPIEKESALDLLGLDMAEIKSARDMYKSTDHQMADKIADRVITWNLWVVMIAILIEIVSVIYIDDKVLIAIISGAIGSVTTALLQERQQVINFFFGSSRGSKSKSKELSKN